MSILIFDTETTGIPERKSYNGYYSYTETQKYDSSRVIELGYMIFSFNIETQKWFQTKASNFIIHPNGFKIENEHIHNITHEYALDNGLKISEVLNVFYEDLISIDKIIGHNLLFDLNVLKAEAYREGNTLLIQKLDAKEKICTMNLGKQKLKLKKFPKLINLYNTLTNEIYEQKHRALDDVKLCAMCYFKLLSQDFEK